MSTSYHSDPIANRTLGPVVLGLVGLGLAMRAAGLLFNGMLDVDQMILDWGARVRTLGLARSFGEIYGVLSYAAFGAAAFLAESVPRFWWAPYKFVELLVESATLLVLCALVSPPRRIFVLLAYWLNPWFILHGSWQGFWDGPHTLMALLAVLTVEFVRRERIAWTLVGVFLTFGALFKPQGLVFLMLPVLVYLVLDLIGGRRLRSRYFAFGAVAVLVVATLLLVVGGASVWALPRNFVTALTVMPNLCNECLNVWRPVTRAAQLALGQHGPTYMLRLPLSAEAVIITLGGVGIWTVTVMFAARRLGTPTRQDFVYAVRLTAAAAVIPLVLGLFRVSRGTEATLIGGRYSPKYGSALIGTALLACGGLLAAGGLGTALKRACDWLAHRFETSRQQEVFGPGTPKVTLLALLAFGGAVLPQIALKTHINHTYAGVVLLIPMVAVCRRALLPWIVMVGINLYGHLAAYGFGRSLILPESASQYVYAGQLVALVRSVRADGWSEELLTLHASANEVVARMLPHEPVLSLFAIAQFFCALLILRQLWMLPVHQASDTPGAQRT